jgi:hypothetical protein
VVPSAGCGQSLLVPHQRQCREVAQLRLGVLDAAAAVPQGQERLAQPPVSSRLSTPAARADGLRPRPSCTAARNRTPAAESDRRYIADRPQ